MLQVTIHLPAIQLTESPQGFRSTVLTPDPEWPGDPSLIFCYQIEDAQESTSRIFGPNNYPYACQLPALPSVFSRTIAAHAWSFSSNRKGGRQTVPPND